MKKLFALLLAMCMLLALAACASDEAAQPADTGDTATAGDTTDAGDAAAEGGEGYQFTFVCPIVGLEYWDMCADGIAAADAEFGTETQVIGPSDPATFVTELPNYI